MHAASVDYDQSPDSGLLLELLLVLKHPEKEAGEAAGHVNLDSSGGFGEFTEDFEAVHEEGLLLDVEVFEFHYLLDVAEEEFEVS